MEILQKLGSLPIFILMFVVIYFLMIRPQSIQQKNHQNMLNNLKKGDKVLTRGGIIGKIVSFQGKNNSIIILSIDDSTNIKVMKSYILSIQN
ncbi:MAG: preprotein translocase subunit YajC [Candidatus Marinimicrobia bacterium]|nr:preprotein translocase subunit YajC [Candidatus Neomarinimicrobiota bacterium]MBS29776.1 preprotein translocase subunit YajC [Candidatus Neomarinimicrobiota bacterium]|tara:strand:- start:968 stop:1243 length:276 start_codon:yes stop_codon:yes gene_type:complete